ncbi:DUF5047 domain-containing protein [Streptomyces canus]|uniref:DUF5047 domain-containing protein n=1 Tax=Streptomyces canus TaxID=58343 RepID=UPI00386DB880|nr:DUF5047 domain-containing protein [Streptomyces canus]
MYPATARFLSTLAESHRVISEVELHRTDGVVELLEHTSGSVTADRGSACRRTCTVTVPDVSVIPRSARDRVNVYGAYLVIRRGIDYGGGKRELVPLGVFRLDQVTGDRAQGPVTLEGKSFEVYLSDDKFTAATSTRGFGTVATAVNYLVSSSMPSLSVDTSRLIDTAIGTTTWDVQGDRMEAIREVAQAAGCEVYCDAAGTLVVAPLPNPLTTPPVWDVAAGERGTLIKASGGMSAAGVYNGILATGENTEDNTVRVSALVVDNDPTSPTYWSGPFGHRPGFISSSTLTTTAACTAAATAELNSRRLPNAVADLSSLPNPALEPGDVIRAIYLDGSRELHQVQSLTIGLEPSSEFTLSLIGSKEDS